MTLKNIATALMACLLLSGCQHAAKPAPDAAIQRDQLSSLVGAGLFLRERCNRADIPADAPLAAAALQEAERKGWAPALNRAQLLDAGKNVAAQLEADATPLQEKCSGFNRSLAPFLARLR
ncbi:type II secretion system pilot lipoprotein GspS [Serratia marcescens]|uniref:type II secretion system pilot lipoprotein GspS n=1 Tax=Serratia marcescens TaxID=615 RepID=UPI0011E7B21A|nr:type II secretion system pilot lipoprotein GspS [Serratia marcescens]